MSDQDNRGASPADPVDLRDAVRPMPAASPVIDVTAAEGPLPERDSAPADPVDSSLLGEGGLPAAERKPAVPNPGDEAPAPLASGPDADPLPDNMEDRAAIIPVAARDPAPARRRKGGFWALFLGGVAAAAIGAGAAFWALPHLPAAWLPQPPAPEVDSGAIVAEATAAARAEVEARSAALIEAARSAGAEAAAAIPPASESPDPALQALEDRVATLETLASRVQALEDRPVFAPAPVTEGSVTQDALAPIRQQIESQARQLQELAARPRVDPADIEAVKAATSRAAEMQAQIESAAGAAEARLADARQAAQKVEAKVAEAARRAEELAALTAFRTALQSGGDRSAAAANLAAAGVEAPAALTADVPSLEDLQAGFDEAARAGLAESRSAGAANGGNRLTDFLRAQTGARSLEPQTGGDPDAVLSRAGAAVVKGDIAGALAEIRALPEAGQAAMAEWTRGAEAWLAASDALGDLEGQIN